MKTRKTEWYRMFTSHNLLSQEQMRFIRNFNDWSDVREYAIETKGYDNFVRFILNNTKISLHEFCKFLGVGDESQN